MASKMSKFAQEKGMRTRPAGEVFAYALEREEVDHEIKYIAAVFEDPMAALNIQEQDNLTTVRQKLRTAIEALDKGDLSIMEGVTRTDEPGSERVTDEELELSMTTVEKVRDLLNDLLNWTGEKSQSK